MLFAFFGSYNYVFQEVYHFNQRHIGLAFLGILVGNLLAVMTFLIFDKTLYAKARVAAKGHPAPEHRLYSAMLGSILLPIGLFVSKINSSRPSCLLLKHISLHHPAFPIPFPPSDTLEYSINSTC
jgi:hypothetical protein